MMCHFTLAENAQVESNMPDINQHRSDLLRCLILYSQWLLLIASIDIDWPDSIAQPMKALGWLWAPSNPETLTIDCLMSDNVGVPVAVQRVVFYITVPLVMLVVLLVLEATAFKALRRRSTAAVSMKDRLGSMTIVVVFFFLPGVLRTVFGFFACVPLDKPVDAPYAAAAIGAYWVNDVSVVCYQRGWHRGLSLGLGLPLAILLCIGMPVAIATLAVLNRKRLHDARFMQHWGFLTRSYRDTRCWWEAVVVCETILLVAIHAFGVNLGALYQSVVMTAALGVQANLLLVFKPYAYEPAGRAMLRGVQCLLLTSYVGLTFQLTNRKSTLENQPPATYGLVMGAVLVVVNFVYVWSVLWQLVRHVQWREIINSLKSAGRNAHAKMRAGRPISEWVGVGQAHKDAAIESGMVRESRTAAP
jgi:hypothetical protein